MTARIAALIVCLSVILTLIGCAKDKPDPETYKVVGSVNTIQKTNGIVDGVKTFYLVTLRNIQPGSLPDSRDAENMGVSITKNTLIYVKTGGKLTKTDAGSIKPGNTAEVEWRFANDHLTEATSITIQ